MSIAASEATEEFIGQPMTPETTTAVENTIATSIFHIMENRTLQSGEPVQMDSIALEIFITNMKGVIKDSNGNPLFCYGCAGSAADVSFPSCAVELRCIGCIRCTEANMNSKLKEGDKMFDKYINADFTVELERLVREAYKEELKKEVIEELNTDKTILTGQKLKRLIKNG